MTYDWDERREDVVSLYAQGNSLTRVKEELYKRKRLKFDASDRAWRLPLNEWEAKGSRRTKAAAVTRPHDRYPSDHLAPAETEVGAAESVGFDDAPEASEVTSSKATVHHGVHVSHTCSCCVAKLEQFTRDLFACLEKDDCLSDIRILPRPMMRAESTVVGADNALHCLARDTKWILHHRYGDVIERSLHPIWGLGLDVDSRDCDGMTALEISIRSDNLQAAGALLDHEASLKFADSGDSSPVPAALDCLSNTRLIARIIRCCQKAGLPLAASGDGTRPLASEQALHSIDTILESSDEERELEDACFVVEHILLNSRRGQKDKGSKHVILRTLLERLCERKPPVRETGPQEIILACVQGLIVGGIEIWATNSCPCPTRNNGKRGNQQCACASPAAIILFHFCCPPILDLALDAGKGRPRDLATLVLSPCSRRDERCDDGYLLNLLSRALELCDGAKDDDRAWAIQALERTPDDLRPMFWDSVVGTVPLDIHGQDYTWEGRSLAESLATMPEPARWNMAERMLIHDPHFPSRSLNQLDETKVTIFPLTPPKQYMLYTSDEYLDYLCHCRPKYAR